MSQEPESVSLDAETRYRLLLEISQRISRTIELQETLDYLLVAVRSAVTYDAAGIFVLNRSLPFTRELTQDVIGGMASVGFTRPAEDDPMLRLGKGIVGHVIATGEAVRTPDVRLDPRYVAGRPTTHSEIAVPIVSNQRVIGALNLESDRLDAFRPEDAELLEFFAVAAALAIEKAMLHREVLEKHRLDQQLAIAQQVQASLLPAAPPQVPGYDVAGVNLPTWEIGGDYFDYIPLPDGRLGLVVADVAGKGVAAALIMATFRAALRTRLGGEGDLARVLADVDGVVRESMGPSRFVTVVYAVLEPRSGTLVYTNCGHNPPLVLRADGRRDLLATGSPALGMTGALRAEFGESTVGHGDVLVLYTDGVVELTGADGVEFGIDRLEHVVRDHGERTAGDVVRAVVEATRAYSGRASYDDDFTLVVVKRGQAAR